MDTYDMLSRRRRFLLFVNGAAFALWQLAQLEALTSVIAADTQLELISLLGAFIWISSLFLLLRFSPKNGLSENELAALNDELVRHNRLIGFQAGFFASIAMAGGLYMLAGYVSFFTRDVLILVLVAGVCTAIFSFAWLEGRGD